MLDKIFDPICSGNILKIKKRNNFQVDENNNGTMPPSFGFSIYDVKMCT
jgi:hypothetical protein